MATMTKNAKQDLAIFTCKVYTTLSNEAQKALLVISTAPAGTKWEHIIFTMAPKTWILHSSISEVEAVKILQPITQKAIKVIPVDQQNKITKIEVLHKIDEGLYENAKVPFHPLDLHTPDFTNQGETIAQYLNKNFDMSNFHWSENNDNAEFPMLFKEDKTDYNEFWNSPLLTDKEKALCKVKKDLDISMSNANRDTRWIFEKVMKTKYAKKAYTLIGLHGNPGSGKTKMVMEDYCATHNIPLLYITLDAGTKAFNLLELVGPEAIEGQVQLVAEQSVLLKCFINKLPLVVCFDEANLMKPDQWNVFAPIISEGRVNIKTHNYVGGHTIKYVLCWNPATSNVRSFDGKFYDRMTFIQVEDVAPQDKITYDQRKFDAYLGENDNSQEAEDWFNNTIDKNKTNFKIKYMGDQNVKIMDTAKRHQCIDEIEKLINSINQQLYIQTKGCDTKNPDKSSYFYISERNMEYFIDLICGYRSVNKAVHRIITDIVPGGKTVVLNGQEYEDDTTIDDMVPEMVAENVSQHLEHEITVLDKLLFTKEDPVEKQAYEEFKDCEFKEELFVDPNEVTSSNSQTTGTYSGMSQEEMEDLVSTIENFQI